MTDHATQYIEKRWGILPRFILYRLNSGRDVKILTVARGGATGTGKTTLSVLLALWVHSLLQCHECRYRNEHGQWVGGYYTREWDSCPYCGSQRAYTQRPWTAEDHAHMSVMEYINNYRFQAQAGECLILDEAETSADSRRSMANENVALSHAWSELRYKNVISIATMPSTLHIDKRMEDLADVKVNVQHRGKAFLDWYWLNDDEKRVWDIPVKNERGQQEMIFFNEIKNNEEYRRLSEMKKNRNEDGEVQEMIDSEELEDRIEDELREMRIRVAEDLNENSDLNQTEIGDVVDRSQQWVSKAVNGNL